MNSNRITRVIIISHYLANVQHTPAQSYKTRQGVRRRTVPHGARALACVALRCGAGSGVNAA